MRKDLLNVFLEINAEYIYNNLCVKNQLYFGELAQLGERLRGTQEVVGSSPIFSITLAVDVGNTASYRLFMRSISEALNGYISVQATAPAHYWQAVNLSYVITYRRPMYAG